jgi:hypothetical protein
VAIAGRDLADGNGCMASAGAVFQRIREFRGGGD